MPLETVAMVLLAVLVWKMLYWEHYRTMLSINVLLRFLKLTWMLRALSGTGREILSILRSFLGGAMREMLLVTLLLFVGFVCAFLMVEKTALDHTLFNLWQALLLTDGGSLEKLLDEENL